MLILLIVSNYNQRYSALLTTSCLDISFDLLLLFHVYIINLYGHDKVSFVLFQLKRLKLQKNNWDSDTFEFDEVLTEFASQKRVYEVVAKPVVEVWIDEMPASFINLVLS